MLSSDSEAKWPSRLLTDSRVEHYWDAQKVVGTWYGEQVTAKAAGHVEWDAYFLYDSGSQWGGDGPSGMTSWGRTIVNSRQQLHDDLLRMLGVEE